LLFFGTPEFAVPTLDAVAGEHDVVLVVAQPDRPAGRGMKLQAPAVAVRARELALPLLQPVKIRTAEFLDEIRRCDADAAVVIAYGRILPASLLAIPRYGFLNVHASILPRWRGAAPIQRAIEAGDGVTGATIMRVDEELDHGPMLAVTSTEIGADERTPSLARRLSILGAEALLPVLRELPDVIETPQDHASATLALKIEKSEGTIRWTDTAAAIYNRFRAFDPWPGLFVRHGEETIKLTDLRPAAGSGAPGVVLELGDDVVIACGEGAIRVTEMQRPGKPRSNAGAIARGLGWR
jgi:methionyl-tRNA formyltransferase